MTEIVWEDPPEKTHGGGGAPVWAKRLAPLRERPGQWANFGQHHASTVTRLRRGQFAEIADGEFEVTSRGIDKDTHKVTLYVRFVGKAGLKAVGE